MPRVRAMGNGTECMEKRSVTTAPLILRRRRHI